MHLSRKFLFMALGAIVVAGSLIVPSSQGADDDLVFLCYRGQTIQVPFYLKPRYTAKGAANGPCFVSPM